MGGHGANRVGKSCNVLILLHALWHSTKPIAKTCKYLKLL
jgi:hypothetical protein